tara:strand:- start:40586 stop:41524 length:939 start_codon:yes stop_codon:yes gene_type:complete
MYKIALIFCMAVFMTYLTPHSSEAKLVEFKPLISAVELENISSNQKLTLIDIRGDAYIKGHIPGSLSAPYPLWRGPSDNPGKLISVSNLNHLLSELGIVSDSYVVIIYQGKNATDFGAAARVYWTLKSAGINNLAILNGGINSWLESGLDVTTDLENIVTSNIEVSFKNTWLSQREDIKAIVSGSEEAVLLDARPKAFYEGEKQHPAAAGPGTLPDAVIYPHDSWFISGSNKIVNPDEATRLYNDSGINLNNTNLVSFCNTGHWAATNWFVFSELINIDGVKLYPESMVGWSHAGLEMMNEPGFWDKVKDAF